MPPKLFELGRIVITPGVVVELARTTSGIAAAKTELDPLLQRHATGDWGELEAEDVALNNFGLREGTRLMSAYTLSTGVKIWIITKADRSVTTILLPEEY